MRWTRIPQIPRRSGRLSLAIHVVLWLLLAAAAAALLLWGRADQTSSVLFFLCVLVAAAVTLHFLWQRAENRSCFDPSDPRYQEEWLLVTEEGIAFSSMIGDGSYRYDSGQLRWQDIILLSIYSDARNQAYRMKITTRENLSHGSFVSKTGPIPTQLYIGLRGYPQEAVRHIESCAAGKVGRLRR